MNRSLYAGRTIMRCCAYSGSRGRSTLRSGGLRQLHAAPLEHLHDHRLRVSQGSFGKSALFTTVVIVLMLEVRTGWIRSIAARAERPG